MTARVIQELAKDGVTPFPSLVMYNRPFKTPIWALLIHLGITILFICAPPAGDAFSFVVGLNTYPTVVLLTAVTVGLIKIRLTKGSDFHSTFTVPWGFLAFYLAGNMVSLYCVLRRYILTHFAVPSRHALRSTVQWQGKHQLTLLAFACGFTRYFGTRHHILRRSIHFIALGIWIHA